MERGSIENRVREVTAEVAGNAIGALAGARFAGDPVVADLVAGMSSPIVSSGLEAVAAGIDAIRGRNIGATLNIAATTLDASIEDMLGRILQDPELLSAFLKVMRAAESTNQAEKILGLGRTLAAILEDDAAYDHELRISKALDLLEAPHFRLLSCMERSRTELEVLRAANGGELGNHQVDAYPRERLAQRSRLGDQVNLVADELMSWGLCGKTSSTSGAVFLENFDFSTMPYSERDIDGSIPLWFRLPLGNVVMERVGIRAHGDTTPEQTPS